MAKTLNSYQEIGHVIERANGRNGVRQIFMRKGYDEPWEGRPCE